MDENEMWERVNQAIDVTGVDCSKPMNGYVVVNDCGTVTDKQCAFTARSNDGTVPGMAVSIMEGVNVTFKEVCRQLSPKVCVLDAVTINNGILVMLVTTQ